MLPTNTSNYDSSNFNPEQIMKTLSDMQAELGAVKQLASEQALKIRQQDETIQNLAKRTLRAEDTVGDFETRIEAINDRYSLISDKVNKNYLQNEDHLVSESMVNSDFQQYALTYHEKMDARMVAVEKCVGIISEEHTKEKSEFTSPEFNSVLLGDVPEVSEDNEFVESLNQVEKVRNPFVPPVVYKREAEGMKSEDSKKRRRSVTNASPLSPKVCKTIFNGTVGKSPSVGRAVNEVVNEDETF